MINLGSFLRFFCKTGPRLTAIIRWQKATKNNEVCFQDIQIRPWILTADCSWTNVAIGQEKWGGWLLPPALGKAGIKAHLLSSVMLLYQVCQFSLLSGWNEHLPHHMLPPGESWGVCCWDRQADRCRTITLCFLLDAASIVNKM